MPKPVSVPKIKGTTSSFSPTYTSEASDWVALYGKELYQFEGNPVSYLRLCRRCLRKDIEIDQILLAFFGGMKYVVGFQPLGDYAEVRCPKSFRWR